MSVPSEGGCSCGEIRYRLMSDPLVTHCCHCLNCQRQTGSAFVINVLIEADRVELLAGEPRRVDVPRDDGSTQKIFRCPTCQVAVYSEYGRSDIRFVRAGTGRPCRSRRSSTSCRSEWITLPSVPAFEVYYDRNASGVATASTRWKRSTGPRLRQQRADVWSRPDRQRCGEDEPPLPGLRGRLYNHRHRRRLRR